MLLPTETRVLRTFLLTLPATTLTELLYAHHVSPDVGWLRNSPATKVVNELLTAISGDCQKTIEIARALVVGFPSRADELTEVQDLIARLDARVGRAGVEARIVVEGERDIAFWLDQIAEPPQDDMAWYNLLASMPSGPGVDFTVPPPEIRRRAVNTISRAESMDTLVLAGRRVLATFPAGRQRDSHLLIVTQGDLGDPWMVPPLEFWGDAFSTACVKGPRMLAALVLAMAPQAWQGYEGPVAELLVKLQKWGIQE